MSISGSFLAAAKMGYVACVAAAVTVSHPPHATPSADSAPTLTMAVVKQLAVARRAIDSVAKTFPLASSRIPHQEMPRSIDGNIALWTADLNRRPAFVAVVTKNGFPNTGAYARTLSWLDAAWSVVAAEQGAGGAGKSVTMPGMPDELVTFVREHEREITALGFTPPPAYVPPDPAHDYFIPATYLRRFYDPGEHTIRLVTTYISDYLQGFIDSADAMPPGRPTQPPLRVLFLGNSLTYYHAMPRLFAQLAAQGLHRRVVAGLVSLPGTSLPHLWEGTDLPEVLQKFPWDVVVMQIHPGGSDSMDAQRAATLISAPILARRGRAIAWGMYRGPNANPSFAAAIDDLVSGAATASHATVAPVPAAWDAVQRADTVLWKRLFDDLPHDDIHPSALGSYLLALSFYTSMTGRSPVGLSTTVGDFPVARADAERLQRIVASLLRGK